MAKFIRYALATICFAASVGCLASWWRSYSIKDEFIAPAYYSTSRAIWVELSNGVALIQVVGHIGKALQFEHTESTRTDVSMIVGETFGCSFGAVYFPIWYPALVLAISGVGVLRFHRQFSIRSALICVTVIAALLGMVVAL